jgi:hypothetical protein
MSRPSAHENAERVAREISEHVQGLCGIVGPIEQDFRAKASTLQP